MGVRVTKYSRGTQTEGREDIYRNISQTDPSDERNCICRYQNSMATQIITQKYQLTMWSLQKPKKSWCRKIMDSLSENFEALQRSKHDNYQTRSSLTCNCIYECSMITSEDIVTLYNMVDQRQDSFEQFKFFAQHIKLDPYRLQAQFYVRVMRNDQWVIRRTCVESYKRIFRISSPELNDYLKRLANFMKNRYNYDEFEYDYDRQRQGHVTMHMTLSSMQIWGIMDDWSRANFKLTRNDLSILDSFGFSNCNCNCYRTMNHYLFYCPQFWWLRKCLLPCPINDLFKDEKKFVKYVREFILRVTPYLELYDWPLY